MADEKKPDAEAGATGDDATEAPIKDVVGILNEYFQAGLPEEITTFKELKLCLQTASGNGNDDDPPADDPANTDNIPIDILTGDQGQGAGSGMMGEPKTDREKAFHMAAQKAESQLNAYRLSQQQSEDAEYKALLDELHTAKKIDANEMAAMLAESKGAKHSFRMSQARKLGGSPGSTFRMSGKVNTGAPTITPDDDKPTDEECRKAAERIRSRNFASAK